MNRPSDQPAKVVRLPFPAAGGPSERAPRPREDRVEIYLLRTFAMVAREGHLTRASERLHLSQPAVSGHIKALEQQFGVALFERTGTGVKLTAAGETLLPLAENVLRAAAELLAHARALSGAVVGRVRLGTIIDPEFLRLGHFLRSMLERHPLLSIETHHGISGAVRERVLSGELDACFCLGEQDDPALEAIELTKVTYRIVAPPAWKKDTDAAGWSEIAAMPWVWTSEHSSHNWLLTKFLAERGLKLARKVIAADQEATMKSLVMAGVGLSLMREDLALAAADAGEVAIWKRFRRQIPLSFLYLASRSGCAAIRAMVRVIGEVWGMAA